MLYKTWQLEVWTEIINVIIATVGRVFPDVAGLALAFLSGRPDLGIAYMALGT